MKKFNQTKKGDTVVIDGLEIIAEVAEQRQRGFIVSGKTKEGVKRMRYDENPNATI